MTDRTQRRIATALDTALLAILITKLGMSIASSIKDGKTEVASSTSAKSSDG